MKNEKLEICWVFQTRQVFSWFIFIIINILKKMQKKCKFFYQK